MPKTGIFWSVAILISFNSYKSRTGSTSSSFSRGSSSYHRGFTSAPPIRTNPSKFDTIFLSTLPSVTAGMIIGVPPAFTIGYRWPLPGKHHLRYWRKSRSMGRIVPARLHRKSLSTHIAFLSWGLPIRVSVPVLHIRYYRRILLCIRYFS